MFYFDEPTHSFYVEGTQPHGAFKLSNEDHVALYDAMARGKKIVIVDGCPQAVEPEPETVTAAQLKEVVTRYRWEVETGGLILDGVKVGTTVADQNRIVSVLARNRGIDTFDFEAQPTVWVTMTRERLEAIDQAIAQHVQACFTAARRHHEAIDALVEQHKADPNSLQRALDEYDEKVGWPE